MYVYIPYLRHFIQLMEVYVTKRVWFCLGMISLDLDVRKSVPFCLGQSDFNVRTSLSTGRVPGGFCAASTAGDLRGSG